MLSTFALFALGQLAKVAIDLDKPVSLALSSNPVVFHGNKLAIVALGEARFVKEDVRLSILPLPSSASSALPPGLYGVRWNNLPPVDPVPQFRIETGPFLRVTIKAGVAQYNDVDYRVSCAVFDSAGVLLGAASHTEQVKYVRLGYMPTLEREITLDFGASKSFVRAAYAVFTISDPVVPAPPDGD